MAGDPHVYENGVCVFCHTMRPKPTTQEMKRYAIAVETAMGGDAKVIADYLPSNYKIDKVDRKLVYISGKDNHGWTLDGYVIPRLESGWIPCREVDSCTCGHWDYEHGNGFECPKNLPEDGEER